MASHTAVAVAAVLLATSVTARGAGFRGDGTSRFADAKPPAPWPEATWRLPTHGWSNATPVRFGSLICSTEEPTTLMCADAATGALRWSATNDYIQALGPEARAAYLEDEARRAAAEEAYATTRAGIGQAKRELRAGKAEAAARVGALTAKLGELAATLASIPNHTTPADREIIGYATATPWAGSDALYAVFGNGVVSRFEPDGTRRWSVWVGPEVDEMRGYHVGTAASPLLTGGVLVVAVGRLLGLSPADGSVVWDAGPWDDFGTSAAVDVGGLPAFVTPTGEVRRARDGEVLATGLGDTWYIGPTVSGQTVFSVGSRGPEQIRQAGSVPAAAWDLTRNGDTVTVTKRWSTTFPGTDPFYTAPVLGDELLYAVDEKARVWGFDPATGELRVNWQDKEPVSPVYGSPAWADGALWIPGENGNWIRFEGPKSHRRWQHPREGVRSMALMEGGTVYVRTLSSLLRFDR